MNAIVVDGSRIEVHCDPGKSEHVARLVLAHRLPPLCGVSMFNPTPFHITLAVTPANPAAYGLAKESLGILADTIALQAFAGESCDVYRH